MFLKNIKKTGVQVFLCCAHYFWSFYYWTQNQNWFIKWLGPRWKTNIIHTLILNSWVICIYLRHLCYFLRKCTFHTLFRAKRNSNCGYPFEWLTVSLKSKHLSSLSDSTGTTRPHCLWKSDCLTILWYCGAHHLCISGVKADGQKLKI